MLALRSARLGTALVLATIVLSGCGDDGTNADGAETPASSATGTTGSTPVAPEDADAASAALRAWGSAKTPEATCALLSDGFARFVGDGDAAGCPKEVERIVGPVRKPITSVESVADSRGQLAVTAETEDGPSTYYLLREGGKWLVNSVNERRAPTYPGEPQP